MNGYPKPLNEFVVTMSPVDRAALLDDLACAPAWIADIFRQVATDPA